MSDFAIEWDKPGERFYETGVDRVVLYPIRDTISDPTDPYDAGVPWNGVTGITQSASGGEPTPLWADNIKYLNLMSAEEANLSINAYTYPDEFEECDGTRSIVTGAIIRQQARKMFGLSYRTLIGNDQKQSEYGYKIHIVYGCLASPSERSYSTVNDSPEAISFSWSVTTTPVEVSGFKPASIITIDTSTITSAKKSAIENILYGTPASGSGQSAVAAVNARLPLPAEIVTTLTT